MSTAQDLDKVYVLPGQILRTYHLYSTCPRLLSGTGRHRVPQLIRLSHAQQLGDVVVCEACLRWRLRGRREDESPTLMSYNLDEVRITLRCACGLHPECSNSDRQVVCRCGRRYRLARIHVIVEEETDEA